MKGTISRILLILCIYSQEVASGIYIILNRMWPGECIMQQEVT